MTDGVIADWGKGDWPVLGPEEKTSSTGPSWHNCNLLGLLPSSRHGVVGPRVDDLFADRLLTLGQDLTRTGDAVVQGVTGVALLVETRHQGNHATAHHRLAGPLGVGQDEDLVVDVRHGYLVGVELALLEDLTQVHDLEAILDDLVRPAEQEEPEVEPLAVELHRDGGTVLGLHVGDGRFDVIDAHRASPVCQKKNTDSRCSVRFRVPEHDTAIL